MQYLALDREARQAALGYDDSYSQSRLDECINSGQWIEAGFIADRRRRDRPEDLEAQAIYESLCVVCRRNVPVAAQVEAQPARDTFDPMGALPSPQRDKAASLPKPTGPWSSPNLPQPSAPALLSVQCGLSAAAIEGARRLAQIQRVAGMLLARAANLGRLERQAPGDWRAEAVEAWMLRFCPPDLPTDHGQFAAMAMDSQTCWLTGCPIQDAIQGDLGQPYERQAFAAWVASEKRDPITGRPLPSSEIDPLLATGVRTDAEGRPTWLLAAQQQLVADAHAFFHDLQQRHIFLAPDATAKVVRQGIDGRRLREPVQIPMDDYLQHWAQVAEPLSAVLRWERAAEREECLRQIRAAERLLGGASLENLAAPLGSPAEALLFAHAIQDRPQKNLEVLRQAHRRYPNDGDVQLTLFSKLMSSSDERLIDEAHQIFPGGHLAAATAATELWGGQGPFPTYLSETLHRRFIGDLNDLLKFLAHVEVAAPLSRQLWLAAMEQNLGTVEAAAAQQRRTLQGFECNLCGEECLPMQDAALANCRCRAKNCKDCVHKGIEVCEAERLVNRCPGGCSTPLTRQDLERLGFDAADVYRRLERVVGGFLDNIPNWRHCTTADCIGGYEVDDAQNFFLCGACKEPNGGPNQEVVEQKTVKQKTLIQRIFRQKEVKQKEVKQEEVKQKEVEQNDVGLIQHLLQGVLCVGIFRECPGCGSGIEKKDGCDHMTCKRCKTQWYMNRFAGIPRTPGVLGRLGFYDGFERGYTPQQINDRAQQWLRHYN